MPTPPVWIPGSNQKSRAWAVRSRDDSHRLPVWLVKVDVEGSSPVREDRLLRDEAVVASLSTPLVGQIHGALVWPVGLVVMVRHGGMGGGSAEGREQKSMISWANVWGRYVGTVIIRRWCEVEEGVTQEGWKCATTKKDQKNEGSQMCSLYTV